MTKLLRAHFYRLFHGSLILVCDKDYSYTLYTVTAND